MATEQYEEEDYEDDDEDIDDEYAVYEAMDWVDQCEGTAPASRALNREVGCSRR